MILLIPGSEDGVGYIEKFSAEKGLSGAPADAKFVEIAEDPAAR